jgi:hypothetical protein
MQPLDLGSSNYVLTADLKAAAFGPGDVAAGGIVNSSWTAGLGGDAAGRLRSQRAAVDAAAHQSLNSFVGGCRLTCRQDRKRMSNPHFRCSGYMSPVSSLADTLRVQVEAAHEKRTPISFCHGDNCQNT